MCKETTSQEADSITILYILLFYFVIICELCSREKYLRSNGRGIGGAKIANCLKSKKKKYKIIFI